eukprot:RCo040050
MTQPSRCSGAGSSGSPSPKVCRAGATRTTGFAGDARTPTRAHSAAPSTSSHRLRTPTSAALQDGSRRISSSVTRSPRAATPDPFSPASTKCRPPVGVSPLSHWERSRCPRRGQADQRSASSSSCFSPEAGTEVSREPTAGMGLGGACEHGVPSGEPQGQVECSAIGCNTAQVEYMRESLAQLRRHSLEQASRFMTLHHEMQAQALAG